MSRHSSWSILLASGLALAAPAAWSSEAPRMAASECGLSSVAGMDLTCHDAGELALLDGTTVVEDASWGATIEDSRRVVAVLGLEGPAVLRSLGAVIAVGPTVDTTGSIPKP